ncbi:MAG: DUF1345 domain-containing protein [Pseudomonadota bacterium]
MPASVHPFAHLHVWHRVLIAAALGVCVGVMMHLIAPQAHWTAVLLFAWLMAGLSYLALLIIGLGKLNAHLSRWRAQRSDPGAATIYSLLALTVWVSLLGVLTISQASSELHGVERWSHIALALASLAVNWLLIQAIFTLRYARLYYAPDDATAETNDIVQGLLFPGGQHPSYSDFAYFALVIGMTSQTADVNIAHTRMRRLAMVHGLTAFSYNIIVLAMTLNLLVGAIG